MQSHVKRTCKVCRALFNARGGRAEPCNLHARGVHSDGFQSLKLWFAAFLFSLRIKIYDKIRVTLYRRHKVSMWHLHNTLLNKQEGKWHEHHAQLPKGKFQPTKMPLFPWLGLSIWPPWCHVQTIHPLYNKAPLSFCFCYFIFFAAWLLWLWFRHNEADH